MSTEVDLESLADGLEQPTSASPAPSSVSLSSLSFRSSLSANRPAITFFGICIGFVTLLAIVAFALILATHPPAPLPSPTWNNFRLPLSVRPSQYSVNMTVDLARLRLSGYETIRVHVALNTSFVVIHSARNVRVTQAFLAPLPTLTPRPNAGESFQKTFLEGRYEHNKRIIYNPTLEHFVLQWRELGLFAGSDVLIGLRFQTRLPTTTMKGVYVSSYLQGGQSKQLVATQFESTDARAAFPCFDEPQFKAQFLLTILHNSSSCISNMPVLSTTAQAHGMTEVTFYPTPPMSSYLLAFVVSDFLFKQQGQVRVYARPEIYAQGVYAADITSRILQAFGGFFNQSYVLPKLDLVAVPDFAAGAMENWGLMTFREILLLFDEKLSSTESKQSVAKVVAHEIAHQWFGNLVTMQWWNEVWLNEGFATFVEYAGVDVVEPSWRIWDHFLADEWSVALAADSLLSASPLSMNEDDVESDDEIDSRFSRISYSKGAAVLRMLQHHLESISPGSFLNGMRAYVRANRYRNSNSREFFSELSRASNNSPVGQFMSSWTFLPGYPELSIGRDPSSNALVITQSRFVLDDVTGVSRRTAPSAGGVRSTTITSRIGGGGGDGAAATAHRTVNYMYLVPVLYRVGTSVRSALMNQFTTSLETWPADQLVIANVNRTGYYRVWYGQDLSAYLADLASASPLQTPADVFGLLDDYWQFSFSRPIDLSNLFRIALLTARKSTSPAVLVTKSVSLLLSAGRLIAPTASISANPANRLVRSVVEFWESSPLANTHDGALIRARVSRYGAVVNSNQTVQSLLRAFELLKASPLDGSDANGVNPDVFAAAYLAAVLKDQSPASRDQVLEWLLARYRLATRASASDRIAALVASAWSPDEAAISRLLTSALNPAIIRPQDRLTVIYTASYSHPALVWQFVQSSWSRLYSLLSHNEISSLCVGVTSHLQSEAELTSARVFLSARGMNADVLDKIVAQGRRAARWVEMFGSDARAAFNTL